MSAMALRSKKHTHCGLQLSQSCQRLDTGNKRLLLLRCAAQGSPDTDRAASAICGPARRQWPFPRRETCSKCYIKMKSIC